MAYIIRRHGLSRRPEVLAIATQLGIDPIHAAGCCCEVWEWADVEADSDGYIRGATQAAIDALTRISGFSEAMARQGWLAIDEDGCHLPNWDRWNGKSAKARRTELEKKRRQRDTTGTRPGHDRDTTGTETGPSTAQHSTAQQQHSTATWSTDALELYRYYPRPGRREESLTAIEEALRHHDVEKLGDAVLMLAERYRTGDADFRKHTPFADRWFRDERWREFR